MRLKYLRLNKKVENVPKKIIVMFSANPNKTAKPKNFSFLTIDPKTNI